MRIVKPRLRAALQRRRPAIVEGLRDLLFVAGTAAVAVAGFTVSTGLGLLIAGAELVMISLVLGGPEEPKK
jgi:hypothetical protein